MILLKLVPYKYHQSGQNQSNFSQCDPTDPADPVPKDTDNNDDNDNAILEWIHFILIFAFRYNYRNCPLHGLCLAPLEGPGTRDTPVVNPFGQGVIPRRFKQKKFCDGRYGNSGYGVSIFYSQN